jgi:hypothetical protein
MKWVGIVVLILGVVGLIFGIMVMMAPVPGFFQIGLAMLLLGIGVALGGYTLFGLMTALAKMAPPG